MAYLPGVPNTTVDAPGKSSVPTRGAPGGIAGVAHSVGKPGRTQHMGSVVGRRGAGISTITGGDPAMHSLNHYGKDAPPLMPGMGGAGVDPTAHAGATMIRGGSGKQNRHARYGGLGPEKMGAPGPSNTDYSFNSPDTE